MQILRLRLKTFTCLAILLLAQAFAIGQNEIKLSEHEKLGQILTDSEGRTLYFFTRDALADTSFCNGGCPNTWPIFHVENPVIGEGLDSTDFSSILRADSLPQTTYKGWPLHYFVRDTVIGETNGEAFNNVWFVAKPDYSIMLVNAQLVGHDGKNYTSQYVEGNEVVQYFVDDYGRTLYTFSRDNYEKNNFTAPDFSNDGVWPIYNTSSVVVPSILSDSLFSSIEVHGKAQLTYKGWPLYFFGQDNTRGNNKGVSFPRPGVWPVGRQGIAEAPFASTIKLANNNNLGQILTDGNGRTLYFFTRDVKPDTSFCNGGCPNTWPIFHASRIVPGEGLDMEDFGTIVRQDSSLQTTYKGWPLHYFVRDTILGETNGEAFNNVWFVAKPDYTIMLMNNQLVGLDGKNYTGSYVEGNEVVQYFVDAYGRTIYTFSRDNFEKNNFTRSDFSNDAVWPILGDSLLAIPSTLSDSLFNSIDVFGRKQLTYKGWPLYYFGRDSLRGQTLGVSFPSPGIWPVTIRDIETASIATSVNQIETLEQLNIYPNPYQDALTLSVKLTESTFINVSLYNNLGQLVKVVWNGTFPQGQSDMTFDDLSQLQNGVYYLKLQNDKGGLQTKILIKE